MRSARVLAIALLLILAGATPSMALWPTTQKLGCWGIYNGTIRQGKIVISLNAVPESVGVYSIHGKWVDPAFSPTYLTTRVLTGTAVVVGTNYFIHAAAARINSKGSAVFENAAFLINRSTLVGSISGYGVLKAKPIACP